MNDEGRVVVVGTGPAGAAAAEFLQRAGVRPLILEAGSASANLGLTARLRGLTIAKLKPRIARRQDLKMLGDPATELYEELAPGGMSNHWACAVPRFAPDDFADAARSDAAYSWPIGYQELVPWYERVEPLLRIAGAERSAQALPAGRVRVGRALGPEWQAVVEAARGVERDVVVMPYAYGAETTLTRAATAFNAYTRLVKPLVRRGGASIRFDAAVRRLIWSARERRVVAVVVQSPGSDREEQIPCRAVVLAAGAVNSAQILLESATPDFPNGLGNAHGVLGRYLHDHPLAKLVVDLGRLVSISPASYITRPSLARSSPLYAAAFMQWCSASEYGRTLLAGHPGQTRTLGFSVFGTMVPTADDRIELDPSARTNGRSALRMFLRYPPQVFTLLSDARSELLAILERAGWAPRERVFRIEAPGNSVHYGGTCRMHASPELGVVDAFSRVYDAPNVVVADSAVFTTAAEKNPVLTAMTLAARASDRLAEEIRAGDL